MFRLLSTYALVRPPRGSNVSGGELLETIVNMRDIMSEQNNQKKIEFEQKIDSILDNNAGEVSVNYLNLEDHDYATLSINEDALTVLSGYVARKMKKTNPAKNCGECSTVLCAPEFCEKNEREKLLSLKSRGYLLVPSQHLYTIIYQVHYFYK